MEKKNIAYNNFIKTKNDIGYKNLAKCDTEVYSGLGLKSGLEVHQQLATKQKLFCHCPAGVYNEFNDFDAELIRHMRPTLTQVRQ